MLCHVVYATMGSIYVTVIKRNGKTVKKNEVADLEEGRLQEKKSLL
jgi:hypothetical protein